MTRQNFENCARGAILKILGNGGGLAHQYDRGSPKHCLGNIEAFLIKWVNVTLTLLPLPLSSPFPFSVFEMYVDKLEERRRILLVVETFNFKLFERDSRAI